METILEQITTLLQQTAPLSEPVHVTAATAPQFGHYQCNSAMKLAKQLGRSPREIATEWVEKLPTEMFSSIEVAGPGFINMTLSPTFLSKAVQQQFHDPHFGVPFPKKVERLVIDFSSPNIAKEMHVGHLRSTIIGDCLARLFEFLGHDVLRLNHVGDWGTAFGMLIAYIEQQGGEPADLPTLMQWYRHAKQRFDADSLFKDLARQAVVRLQSEEPGALAIWHRICEISRLAYQQVYDLLDVKLVERGESFYNPLLAETVADLEKKGLITLSDGAKCLFHEGYEIPFMVQKSDGGYNYDTTDLAAMRHRIDVEKARRIIVVTDAGQALHFQLLKQTAEKAGYLKEVRFDHVPFGVVLGPDGKKFKTRSGEVERLIDLLHAAIHKANEILIARGSDLPEEQRLELASVLGIGAVKYADLSTNRVGDYTFSYDRMLRFEGNTAAFILYAYVRIAGIKRKIAGEVVLEPIVLEHPSEIDLGLHLLRFGEMLSTLAESLLPNLLTDYLYELACKFHLFFRDCRVEGSEYEARRLCLCEASSRILEKGLYILGLKTVERM